MGICIKCIKLEYLKPCYFVQIICIRLEYLIWYSCVKKQQYENVNINVQWMQFPDILA